MPLETFTKASFKEELFDFLCEKFDEAEESDSSLPDSAFLGRLSRASVNEENPLFVSQIIKMIHDYVHQMERQDKSIGPVVWHLSNIIKFDFKHNLEFLIESLDDDPIQKDEFILLMMHYFSKECNYNGYLVHDDDPKEHEITVGIDDSISLIPSISALYYRLNQVIENDPSSNTRIQIIVRQNEHYTPIDINKETRQCLIIDAASDSKELTLRDFIKYTNNLDKMVYVAQHNYLIPETLAHSDTSNIGTSRVQKDLWSCSIFSLEYSRLLATKPDAHEHYMSVARQEPSNLELYSVSWDELDPEFIRISQSPTYKAYYSETKRELNPSIDSIFSECNFFQLKSKFQSIAASAIQEYSEDELRKLTSPMHSPIKNSTI
ncbi:MAG: hypothetical protein P1U74_03550 [Legionellaceae bacterium]|nr:hypothetical protein [Legionellaceae bacterium]